MTKSEINKKIVVDARQKIAELGLEGKLDIFPVCNVFTRRPRYWKDGELNLFKVHMWNLNELDSEQISEVLEERIMAARMYFGL